MFVNLFFGAAGYAWFQQPNPERQFEEALAAQQRGDTDVALKLYEALARANPGKVAVRVNLGALLVDVGRFNEAIANYKAGLRAEPQNKDLRLGLNAAREDKGDPASLEEARSDLERLHANEPQDRTVTMMLADVLNHQQQYPQAIKLLVPLMAGAAGDDDLEFLLGTAMIRSGHTTQGVELADRIASRTGRADAYLLAGEARLAMSQFDLAQRDAEAALEKEPELAGADTLHGMALEQRGDYSAAALALRKAIAANPEDFNANYYFGALLYFERDLPNASARLEKALQLQPQSAEARYKLALVEQLTGSSAAALRDLETVTRQRPDWLEPHVKLAALYFSLHRLAEGARESKRVDQLVGTEQQKALAKP